LILFPVGFTYARGPLEYCNSIESPPLYLISFDQYGMPEFYLNTDHNQTQAHLSNEHQNEVTNFLDHIAYSSTADRGIGLNID